MIYIIITNDLCQILFYYYKKTDLPVHSFLRSYKKIFHAYGSVTHESFIKAGALFLLAEELIPFSVKFYGKIRAICL